MKMFIFLSLCFPVFAQALVADKFQCELKQTDVLSGVTTSQKTTMQAVRLPTAGGVDYNLTTGSLEFRNELNKDGYSYFSNTSITYRHATRNKGAPLDPRQDICISVGGGICKTGSKDCLATISACPSQEPYGVPGWTPVGLFNGIPVFDDKGLSASVEIGDDANRMDIFVSCKFLGTLQ